MMVYPYGKLMHLGVLIFILCISMISVFIGSPLSNLMLLFLLIFMSLLPSEYLIGLVFLGMRSLCCMTNFRLKMKRERGSG